MQLLDFSWRPVGHLCLVSPSAIYALKKRSSLPGNPPPADGKDLADKTVGGVAAEKGGEGGVFAGGDQAAERDLAFEPFLKGGPRLCFGGKIGGVIDKVLGNGIYLHVMGGDFYPDRLNIGQLRAPGGAVGGGALHPAQGGRAADQEDLPAAPFDHLR